MTEIKDKRNAIQPLHYALPNGKEVIDVIALATYQLKGVVACDIGNVVKYIMRAGKKPSDTSINQTLEEKGQEDKEKSNWYINHGISNFTEDMFISNAIINKVEFSENDVLNYLLSTNQKSIYQIMKLLLTHTTSFKEKYKLLNEVAKEIKNLI